MRFEMAGKTRPVCTSGRQTDRQARQSVSTQTAFRMHINYVFLWLSNINTLGLVIQESGGVW